MTPVLLCAYRPRYLTLVLKWLMSPSFGQKYRLFVWDNGDASEIFRDAGLEWHRVLDEDSGKVVNIGKALAMQYLVDVANRSLEDFDCYVCMDDDIIVDCAHLDALVNTARRPNLGMVAGFMHPFNSAVPSGGSITLLDPCNACTGANKLLNATTCQICGGTGVDAGGQRLRTYPAQDRTEKMQAKIAGGLFAVSKSSVDRLPWAPYLYPILTTADHKPAVYWTEDASLDFGLTKAGLLNGYLDNMDFPPAIHLPDLDEAYVQWKRMARNDPLLTPAYAPSGQTPVAVKPDRDAAT